MRRIHFYNALIVSTALAFTLPAAQSSAAPPAPGVVTTNDGTATSKAAPSCWAIKQSFPASADGTYWLLTNKLVAPQQFYCDMTTDGGGYVLIGRGREGWTWAWRGQGTASALRTNNVSPSAFSPTAMHTNTVDALLNGTSPDTLTDGIRIRRAANDTGTTWQEVRMHIHHSARWSWAMPGGTWLSSTEVDGTMYNFAPTNQYDNGTTRDANPNWANNHTRVWTHTWGPHNNKQGFSYGSSVAGSNSASSYLWSYSTENHATPFAQVWIRPMLSDADMGYTSIPNTGLAGSTVRPLPSNNPQTMQWGVNGAVKPGNASISLAALAPSTNAGDQTTVEFWMNWNGNHNQMPFGFANYDLYFRWDGRFGFNGACGDNWGIPSTGLAKRWVHVAAVFTNGNTAANKLYIDGVDQTLGGNIACNQSVSSTARISGWPNDSGYGFQGRIDEFAIYNGALDSAAVSSHYSVGKGLTAGPYSAAVLANTPMQYLRLGDASNTMADSSGNNLVGTCIACSKLQTGAIANEADKSALFAGIDPDPNNVSPVFALQQIGNTMFVGGQFATVNNGAGGATYPQRFLAAFDVQTGVWIPSFAPSLDGAVWDLKATPDGKLIVGGNFTNINGAANTAGLAALDPNTGAVSTAWTATLSGSRFLGARPHTRSLDIQGNWLYIGGSYNAVAGGPSMVSRATGGISRVSLTDGTPDINFKRHFSDTIMDIDANADGQRLYVVGFFKYNGATGLTMTSESNATAILDTVTGAPIPGMKQYVPSTGNTSRQWQQTITEYNGNVYQGGSEHNFHQYDPTDYTLKRGHIGWFGGDFQASAAADGVVYGSCHCFMYSYTDATTWAAVYNYSQVDQINWLSAYDANTFDKVTDFDPQWGFASTGEGPWEIVFDSYGCLWSGGDIVKGAYRNGKYDWLGGFARFCPRDSTAPGLPTGFKKISNGATTAVKWALSTDNSGVAPTYEVLLEDRVIGMTSGSQFVVTTPGRYFVRAVDVGGNRSATTSVVVV